MKFYLPVRNELLKQSRFCYGSRYCYLWKNIDFFYFLTQIVRRLTILEFIVTELGKKIPTEEDLIDECGRSLIDFSGAQSHVPTFTTEGCG